MTDYGDLVHRIADPGAAASDRTAAERELCMQLAARIRRYGLRHLRNEAAAADLVQEALLTLLRGVREGRIEQAENVDRFVLGTCRHLVAHLRRSERRARTFENAVLPLAQADLPPAYSRVDASRLALCLSTIPAREQRVVILTFQEDRSAEEIAIELGTSAGNVRVLRHRAVAALQRCVEGAVS